MRLSRFIVPALICMLFISCDSKEEEIPVTSITLSQSTARLIVGESLMLEARISPSSATNVSITWASSEPDVASVTQNGIVTAQAEGTAVILATERGGVVGRCTVTVTKPNVDVVSIKINHSELFLIEGDEVNLVASVSPQDATDSTVSWETSDAEVATVSAEGLVKAVKEGTAIVKASAGNKTAECHITVNYVHVASISISHSDVSISVGRVLQLTASVTPENAKYNYISWSSSDESVATVTEQGLVTAVGKGTASITASADSKSATCLVTVYVSLSGISLSVKELNLYTGKQYILGVIKDPLDATFEGDIQWSSSDESVLVVSNKGVIATKKKGTAVVSAMVDGFTASCAVTVYDAINGLALDKTRLTLNRGGHYKLSYILDPVGAILFGEVNWSSSDPSIASVDDDGNVYANNVGTCNITFMCDEGFTATCRVTVEIPIESITLSEDLFNMKVGDSFQLIASIYPADATQRTLNWTSSDPNIVRVDSNGMCYAIDGGHSTIRVSSGDVFAECEIDVLVPVTSLLLDRASALMMPGETLTLSADVLPSNASDKSLSWSSSDSAVASVRDGVITAVGAGVSTVSVTCGNCSAYCIVRVIDSLSLNKEEVKLIVNNSYNLQIIIRPEDIDYKGIPIVWETSDESIARVSESGIVTAVFAGEAVIKARVDNREVSCKVICEELSGDNEGTGSEIWK